MKNKILISIFLGMFLVTPVLAQELYQPSVEELIKETKLIQEAEKNAATSSLVLPKMTIVELKRIKGEKQVLAEILENKKNNIPKTEIAKEYRYTLTDVIEKLLFWSEQHPESGDQVRQALKIQSDFEDEISPLLEKIEGKNKVRRFFFGTNYRDAKEIEAQVKKAKRKMGEMELFQEQFNNRTDWEIWGQNTYNLRTGLEKVAEKIKNEKERFSFFGWVKGIFI